MAGHQNRKLLISLAVAVAPAMAWADPPSAVGGPQPDPAAASAQRPIEDAQVVAKIGSEVVLAAELMPAVHQFLARNAQQIPPEQLEAARKVVMQEQLNMLIDIKLLYADGRRSIPAENFPRVEEMLGKRFEKDRLPQLYKATGTNNRLELDAKLREIGSSIDQQQRSYAEQAFARQWLREKVQTKEEFTHEELLAYYRAHQSEFEFESRARWEEIVVRWDRFPTQAKAWETIANLGNEIGEGRSTFSDVARRHSDGVTADDGGRYDWTSKGSLVSAEVDRAIFQLPVGTLSKILEDEAGLRIIRVTERKEAGRTPFQEAIPEIRERIRKEEFNGKIRDYLSSLRRITPVWTIFDEPPVQSATTGMKTPR